MKLRARSNGSIETEKKISEGHFNDSGFDPLAERRCFDVYSMSNTLSPPIVHSMESDSFLAKMMTTGPSTIVALQSRRIDFVIQTIAGYCERSVLESPHVHAIAATTVRSSYDA